MGNVLYNISQVLGVTIIHSLWQGLLIYFMLRFALVFSAHFSSSKKYMMAVASLFAITGWFIYTLVNEIHIYNWLVVMPAKLSAMPLALELPAGIRRFDDQNIRYYYNLENYLPYITILYIAGLVFNTSKLIIAREKIKTIKQTMSIDIALQYHTTKFAGMLGIGKHVSVGLSKLVDAPCMVGYLKPVILLPFALASYLSADEIEAILLHELAHIKRNDYLINLLQQVIAIILFFNPCTQLINRIINEERENCCDDMVVNTTANPLTYAKALLKLEQTRGNNLQLAMSAIGKKYYLFNRIERIMKTKKQIPSMRPALLAMVILTIGIGSIALLNPEIAQGKISIKAVVPVINSLLSDTGHKSKVVKKTTIAKKNAHIKSDDKNKSYSWSENDNYNDPELEKLSQEVEKYGEAISKYYDSPEFRKQSEEMEQKGKQLEAFYDKPEQKELQEKLEKLGKDFEKNWGETSESRETNEKMEALSKKIEKYFSSPGFKEVNARLEKKYGITHGHHGEEGNDENYRKYQDELKTHIPVEITQATDQLKDLGERIRKRYDSPELHAQSEKIKMLGDSLRKAYENPQIKEQQEEMRRLGEKMRDFSNDPEMKRQQELLNEATAKLKAYMNTPKFRKHISEMRKRSDAFERVEEQEKPEKPEAPEKPEKPEEDN